MKPSLEFKFDDARKIRLAQLIFFSCILSPDATIFLSGQSYSCIVRKFWYHQI